MLLVGRGKEREKKPIASHFYRGGDFFSSLLIVSGKKGGLLEERGGKKKGCLLQLPQNASVVSQG